MSKLKSKEVGISEPATMPATRTMGSSIDEYIALLNDVCEFSDIDDANYGSVGMTLYKLRNLPFSLQVATEALEQAMVDSQEFTAYSITEIFSALYPTLVQSLLEAQEIEAVEEDTQHEIFYQYSTFCSHTLPQTKTDKIEAVTEYTNNKLTVSCTKGLPYGGVARIIILYVNSMAVKYKSREIDIGGSIRQFANRLGYSSSYIPGGINEQVLTQLEKLFHTTYIHSTNVKTVTADNEHIIEKKDTRLHLFDEALTWEHIKNDLTTNAVAKVILSEQYFQEIIKHPVPLSLDAIKSMKKSALALDLYAFIAYRANTSKLVPAKLSNLQKQFCYDGPTWRFKEKLERALKLVEKAWPESKVMLKGDVLLIPKMATHIAKLN
jgi:hypothetical protein